MSAHPEVVENALRVRERCRAAALRASRDPSEVTLVAVAKTQPRERALAVLEAGVPDVGENRVQEAEEKWAGGSAPDLRLHLVGRLQRNKARRAARLFDVVHSCDSLPLARRLSDVSRAEGRSLRVLLEVNVASEESKAGFAPDELRAAIGPLAELPALELRGLMTIAPRVAHPEEARPHFAALCELARELAEAQPGLGTELSMGMTDDFEIAIEEGATLVRVGRAIYGERPLLLG